MTLHYWKVVSSSKNQSFRVFSIRTDRAVSPRTGEAHDFYILESNPWVNVIPLTPKEEIVLIRQYRHGTQQNTLEIPGGLVEDYDNPKSAAIRELKEETGYEGSYVQQVSMVYPNPAIQNNACYTFLIKDVIKTDKQDLDEKEDIEIVIKPLLEIPALIRSEVINHSLVIAALLRFFMDFYPHYLL